MDIVNLSNKFFETHSDCPEILKKGSRPYMLVLIKIDDITFAIPFRSNIKHKYVYWTDKQNNCGLDFTKSVVISSDDDIACHNVQIRQNEFNAVKGREYFITQKFSTFLSTYKKAYKNLNIERNKTLINNSALQYFIEEIF